MMGSRAQTSDVTSLGALAVMLADPAAFADRVQQLKEAREAYDQAKADAEIAIGNQRAIAHALENDRQVIEGERLQAQLAAESVIADRESLARLADELANQRSQLQAEIDGHRQDAARLEEAVQQRMQQLSTRSLMLDDREKGLFARAAQLESLNADLATRSETLIRDQAALEARQVALRAALDV